MTKFEAGKAYKTRDGRTARIYAVDCGGSFPIHGAILSPNSLIACATQWTVKGNSCNSFIESDSDLMPPTEHETRGNADIFASEGRIACVPLTYYKGEGLE